MLSLHLSVCFSHTSPLSPSPGFFAGSSLTPRLFYSLQFEAQLMPRFISAVLKRPLGLHPTTHEQAHSLGPQTEILCHILLVQINFWHCCVFTCLCVSVCMMMLTFSGMRVCVFTSGNSAGFFDMHVRLFFFAAGNTIIMLPHALLLSLTDKLSVG